MVDINFKRIEKKWQKKWEEQKVFVADDKSKKSNYYVLEMFPYPSGSGLHMGHAWNYTIGDILARFKLMKGFNVLHPMGYDSLGLPAENAAIEAGVHPEEYTKKSIKNYIKQQKNLGLSYDWSRMVVSSDPKYYKWDQWIFLKMLEKGLAYQKESNVNWCPKCDTVLANEQVQEGKCWRHEDTEVEVRNLKQWFLKTTAYADELYEGIDKLKDWPERTKTMQKHWIGKSHGTEIDFEVENKVGNVVIVHGANSSEKAAYEGGVENTRHWFPWIRKELDKKEIVFSNELYPKDWNPNYEEWKNIFEKNKIDMNTTLVGHSLGCGFVLRWLAENKRKVKKVILVAPYVLDSDELPGLKKMVNFEFDTSLDDLWEELIVFSSEDDEDYILKSVKEINKKLNSKHISFKDKGYFTRGSLGTEKFPELLEEITKKEKWPVFTTRPDTLFGVTFVVVAAQHPKLWDLVTNEQKKDVEKFLKKLKSVSEKDMADLEKEGVFTGSYAVNPINDEKVPIYAGNFVVADYGSGMVMAVPAHDKRDFEFAKKYGIEIKPVINPKDFEYEKVLSEAYTGEGTLINSGEFNGLESDEAKEKITSWLENKESGRKTLNFRLRDWGVSRQRYWGTPIPIIYCEKCGAVPIPEKDLPVVLPKEVKFGKGNPLETNEKWIKTKCPSCKGEGRRETDTMDTFANSSWYFLRYCDSKNDKDIFDKKKVKKWCPVDSYIGGAEHACMHLIYFRFYTKFLRDIGLLDFDEPVKRLFHQGMLHAEGGDKMSKSKGNEVVPEAVSDVYGIDTARFFLSSLASPDKDIDWLEKGIVGSLRFVNRVMEFKGWDKKDSLELEVKLNNVVKNVSEYYENFKYRKATIELRELFELIDGGCSKKTFGVFLKLLNPICPHITEELWEKLGEKKVLSNSPWPEFDSKNLKIKKKEIDLNSKVTIHLKEMIKRLEEKGTKIKKVHLYVIPFEISKFDSKLIGKELGKEVFVYSVKDEKKKDPEGKSKKAKPGMPGVWFE